MVDKDKSHFGGSWGGSTVVQGKNFVKLTALRML